ncbi:MAG TPA: CRISPR-associated endonuclease Cas1 [Phycisphaerales bacterium]|nr:CRISPR-associated endonuclease Cas1 [Phycisphaerales bacterium]HMP38569.1 CRISPR-associated endonuclease Cas1 [Phycisphaerales bacterium]
MRIHRVRFLIETSEFVTLHAHAAGVLYAVVGEANGLARAESPFFPDGAMVLAPEQCRVMIRPHDPYAFGLTILGDDPSAARLVDALREGLRRAGGEARPPAGKGAPGSAAKLPLRGNFRLLRVEDCVAGRELPEGERPAAIPDSLLERQVERARGHDLLTLRFTSPLRIQRPKDRREVGHSHVDQGFFDGFQFRRRLFERLSALGMAPPDADRRTGAIDIVENGLTWIDLTYGGGADGRTALGGSSGRVVIRTRDPIVVRALVLGQYVHVGQNSRFGFGGYRIEEVGADPFECARAVGLLELALRSSDVERAAELYDLPSGGLQKLRSAAAAGRHRAGPCVRVAIAKAEGLDAPVRMLAIPPAPDRVLQKALHAALAPALDRFFEDSSIAYRRGLGRHRAARKLREAYERGYRFALHTDFAKFFDSIDHRILENRLLAYLNDVGTVHFIMEAVRAGSPREHCGIPTGSPLSPLLANLFLDQFDEEIAKTGALLVRYADDFVLLYRTEPEAQRAHAAAAAAADSLALSLNESKTRLVELGQPFEFLGFRFERRGSGGSWSATALHEPCRVEELGWRQADPRRRTLSEAVSLPGETRQCALSARSVVLAGPGAASIDARDGELIVRYGDDPGSVTFPLQRLGELVVLGRVAISARFLGSLASVGASCVVADSSGRHPVELVAGEGVPSSELIAAQVDCSRDERWQLALSRRLISAKLENHAVLAESVACSPTGRASKPMIAETADELRRLARSAAQIDSIESLLGVEGAGAARWYRLFGRLLPGWCDFVRRVAPDADDPGNVLLNLAHTWLHRHCAVALRAVGFAVGLGILHKPRSGFAALASDLHEPFRHVMDRAVLHVIQGLRPDDFALARPESPYRISLQPRALRKVMEGLAEAFTMTVAAAGQASPISYAAQIHNGARSLARHLLDRSQVFEPFRHPPDAGSSQSQAIREAG